MKTGVGKLEKPSSPIIQPVNPAPCTSGGGIYPNIDTNIGIDIDIDTAVVSSKRRPGCLCLVCKFCCACNNVEQKHFAPPLPSCVLVFYHHRIPRCSTNRRASRLSQQHNVKKRLVCTDTHPPTHTHARTAAHTPTHTHTKSCTHTHTHTHTHTPHTLLPDTRHHT